jgi:hypothetical protein
MSESFAGRKRSVMKNKVQCVPPVQWERIFLNTDGLKWRQIMGSPLISRVRDVHVSNLFVFAWVYSAAATRSWGTGALPVNKA